MAELDVEFDMHDTESERLCWCLPEKDGGLWWHNVFGLDLKGMRGK